MGSEIFENSWKIIKENKFELVNQINNDLICNICKKLMIKACCCPCGCRYCSYCIEEYLNGEDKICPGKSKFCQIKMINFEKDVVIDYPYNISISEIVVKCPNKSCEFTNELCLIEDHVRTCDKKPLSCPYFEIGCKNDVMNDGMKDHLCTDIYCHTKLLLDFIHNIRNENESMRNEIAELKSENKHLKEELEIIEIESKNNQIEMRKIIDEISDKNGDLINKSNNHDKELNDLQIRIIEIARITEQICFEIFEWKIENFTQQQKITDIYSKPFYSHKNGYKMCLSVWIEAHCVGVYFHLMKGEFDNDLMWPFRHGITIDIISQIPINESKTIKYDDDINNKKWNKPTTERNDRICFHSIHIYFPEIIKSKEIIQNNQLLIKCKINIRQQI